jgi:hypothetical protein
LSWLIESGAKIARLRLTSQGYVAEPVPAGDPCADGIYGDPVTAWPLWRWMLWIGDAAPDGYALYDVTEGAWDALDLPGLASCQAMCESDGYLWIAGTFDNNEGVLYRYDGSTWVEDAAPNQTERMVALFDVDGVLHGLTSGTTGRCYRWQNWAWVEMEMPQLVVGRGGTAGVGVDGRAWWTDGEMVSGEHGEQIAVRNGQAAMAGLAGKVLTIAESVQSGLQGLRWVDGGGARSLAEWSAEDAILDNLVVWRNRVWAFGQLGSAPKVLRHGGRGTVFAEPGPWRVDKAVGGWVAIALGRVLTESGSIGQVVLETCDAVRLDDLAHEWSDGTGTSPRLDSLTHEWSKGPDNRPRLDSLAHEWSDGTGTSPQLDSLAHEWRDGTGASPELQALTHEWQDTDVGTAGGPRLDELVHEWADAVPGPGDDLVRFVVLDGAATVLAVRVCVEETLSQIGDWRCIMRLDREDLDVDAWDTYEEFEIGRNHVPGQIGTELRVGIIGPWATERAPGFRVDVRR